MVCGTSPLNSCLIPCDDISPLEEYDEESGETEREAEREPHDVADDFGWKAKAIVSRSNGVCFHQARVAHCSVLYKVDNTS
ncbi:hypothetical protein KSX_52500 [Ktedonospora formicarum]|uniref:Uncharacterized protein n=1 Tax=Ktedonospora formicarum TaxID=2778364 RepID=A0A8J3HZH8_9CHLR|nr:hypothetical protein KSX_52500 [Ktedonospora formicarum]